MSKRGKWSVILFIVTLMIISLVGCGKSENTESAKKDQPGKVYKIRLAEFYAPNGGGLAKAGRWWADEVEKRTGGRVKIETGWSESFGKVAELPDLVRSGAVEMAAIAPGYYPKQMPLWNILSAVPFATTEPAITERVVWELYDTFPAMQEELKKNNIKLLYIGVLNPYKFLSNKPINTIDDMKGLKIRSWGTFVPKMLEAAGAVPVNISVADAYDAFSRGTVDVQVGPVDMIVGQGWADLGKYLTHANFSSPLAACGAINLDFWNTLPKDIQDIMLQVGREHEQTIIKMLKEDEEQSTKKLTEKGVKSIEFSAVERAKWVEKSPKFMEQWSKDMDAQGIPGKEFVQRYSDIMSKIQAKK